MPRLAWVVLIADVFSLFDGHTPLNYDVYHDRGICRPPRAPRLGARFEW